MKKTRRRTIVEFAFWGGAALLLLNFQSIVDSFRGPIDYDAANAGKVTLYSTQSCGYCRKARHFLDTHDVPYTERDIEQSASAYRDFQNLGGSGVPVITVGNQVMHGYSVSGLRAALHCADCAQP